MNSYSFENLEVYKSARQYRVKIYKLTHQLPEYEKYNLTLQMRKAALSITNNIAEGHGRYHWQENIQFIRQSRGSLQEIIDDLNTCLDEKYAAEDLLNNLKIEGYNLLKQLNSYMKYLKGRKEAETRQMIA
ncbi:MAG: four helix bundle protein [Sedimentisphaerales bacterium]|nr:four helix bundle protein [Sedimentisphaerales bacterium]